MKCDLLMFITEMLHEFHELSRHWHGIDDDEYALKKIRKQHQWKQILLHLIVIPVYIYKYFHLKLKKNM